MLTRAEQRRRSATAPVELLQMDVTQLNFPNRFFDGAVATFLFCTLPNELQVQALQELGRTVKPGRKHPTPRMHTAERGDSARHQPTMGTMGTLRLWGWFR
jgi:ubiquinone/menaquinone biosynthesis C-methylase UbiE